MSRILTLNIGASKAVLAEYSLSGKSSLSLVAYGSSAMNGVDVNDPGMLGAQLPNVIHQIMHEKGIRPAPLVVSLGGQMVFPRFAKIPPVSDKDKLDQLVSNEIEQNVPFPVDEIVSDHQFLGETPDGDMAAMIVAAKLEGVRAVTDAVRAAGLKPAKVDVSPLAICNALKFSYPNLAGCSVILDIGSKTTNLILLENEKIYNRSIPVAGNTITKDISQAFGCTFEEAEQLKIDRGYVALGGVTEDEDEVTDRVSKIIRTVLTRLHAEISRSINFYRSQQGGSAPTRLFLTGGTARLPQLAEFFMESLQVEVDFLNPFSRISFGAKVDKTALEGDTFELVESVGLALRGTDAPWISVNLMPPELIEEERAIKRLPFLAVGGLALLGALGLGILTAGNARDLAVSEKDQIESRNSKLETDRGELSKNAMAMKIAGDRCDELQKLMWSRSAVLHQVEAVKASLLDGMWIKSWKKPGRQDEDSSSNAAAADNMVVVTIRGWGDAMTKARQGETGSIDNIVVGRLKKRREIVAETVQVIAKNEVKGGISEFSIRMAFADAPSAVNTEKQNSGEAVQ